MKVLIAEDDPNIRRGLTDVLTNEGYSVIEAADGTQAIEHFTSHAPDIICLDIMMPGVNGYDVCRDLRADKIATPILMLTAKGQEMDKVIGLDTGADDYVTKPFGLRELLSRIKALLRRAGGTDGGEDDLPQEPFQIGASTINPVTFQIEGKDGTQDLTAKELKLLQFFYAHAGEALSRDRLLNEVWGYNYYGTTRTLDQVIVQLRKKLNDNKGAPKRLLTVHGVGYKLAL